MANKPHHGMSSPKRMRGLMAGDHLPQRTNTGYDDSKGYEGSSSRRLGKHTGAEAKGDSRRRSGPEGDSRGSAPPGVGKGTGVRGSVSSHGGDAGRGDRGRLGKGDAYKGKPTALSEDISHESFERLGAE